MKSAISSCVSFKIFYVKFSFYSFSTTQLYIRICVSHICEFAADFSEITHYMISFRVHFFLSLCFLPLAESASKKSADRASNNLIAQITSLPGFDTSKARIVKRSVSRQSPEREPILPTAAEAFLPWRRDKSLQSFIGGTFQMKYSVQLFSLLLFQFVKFYSVES